MLISGISVISGHVCCTRISLRIRPIDRLGTKFDSSSLVRFNKLGTFVFDVGANY